MYTFADWNKTPWAKIDVDMLIEETKKLTKDVKMLNKAVSTTHDRSVEMVLVKLLYLAHCQWLCFAVLIAHGQTLYASGDAAAQAWRCSCAGTGWPSTT
jgi:hypothetical protein